MSPFSYYLVWRNQRVPLTPYEGGRMWSAMTLGWWEPPELLGSPITLERDDWTAS
jgi:hypothetical protein